MLSAFTMNSHQKIQKTQHCHNQLICMYVCVRACVRASEHACVSKWVSEVDINFLNCFPPYFVRQSYSKLGTHWLGWVHWPQSCRVTDTWCHICFLRVLGIWIRLSRVWSKLFINWATFPAPNMYVFALISLFMLLHTNKSAGSISHGKYPHTPRPKLPCHREPPN